MELDMADVLLNGCPVDYNLVSIRLQLKDGGIEIGPPRPPQIGKSIVSSNIEDYYYDDDGDNTDSDPVANLILHVYNEYAEEVEIEYQPVSKQEDTRWGFWCDGHTLKTVIPYKFWKTHWCPGGFGKEHENGHLQLHNVIRRPTVVNKAICGINEYNTHNNNFGRNSEEPPILPSSSPSRASAVSSFHMAGINICQCRSSLNVSHNNDKVVDNKSNMRNGISCSKQVSTALQPLPVGALVQSSSSRAGSDTRVIKVKCQRPPGSPASSEDFELAIKVRCSRPVSPIQVDLETKVRCSRPDSPAQVSESATKTRHLLVTDASEPPAKTRHISSTEASETTTKTMQLSSPEASERTMRATELSSTEASDRLVESRCTTPSSASEALARAKEALARVQQMTERVAKSGPGSSIDSFDQLSDSRCSTPCLPSEALARAKDALARVQTNRPHRPSPSTPKLRVPYRSLANTEVYVRALATTAASTAAIAPLQVNLHPPEKGAPINTSVVLRKSFSGDTSDLFDSFSESAYILSRGTTAQHFGQQREPIVVGQVIAKDAEKMERKDIWKAAFEKFVSKEKAYLVKHHKKSIEFLKETMEFISKEKAAILIQGKKYFAAAKRRELTLTKLECIFCLRIAPPKEDSDGNINWKTFNYVKSWKNTKVSHQSKISLVTTGTNTAPCTPTSVDGHSQTWVCQSMS